MIIWSHIGEFGRNLSTILAALSFARLTRNTGLRVSPSCLGKSLPVFRRSDPEQTAGQSFRRYLKNNKESDILKTIAVLGTGNIAQTISVDMKARGHEVRLFAPQYLFSRIRFIAETHEIECTGAFEAKETIDVVTSDIDEAVRGADYIFATRNTQSFSRDIRLRIRSLSPSTAAWRLSSTKTSGATTIPVPFS